jgi:hypothetical protein
LPRNGRRTLEGTRRFVNYETLFFSEKTPGAVGAMKIGGTERVLPANRVVKVESPEKPAKEATFVRTVA